MFDPNRYTETFTREQGLTLCDWHQLLPGAVGEHRLERAPDANQAQVHIGPGRLHLRWTELPPRRIALVRMPRLEVHYQFIDLPADMRVRFMRYFDLYCQRGGG
jgi:hypothetical protein